MSEGTAPLAALRAEIDAIDRSIQDLLIRRASIADQVRSSKAGAPVWRPTREAQVLRQLIARHTGPFSKATLVQIWREIMSAMLRLQGDFAAAVYAIDGDRSFRELARGHFGTETPIAHYASARAVLTAVQDGSATVGVLPLPEDSEAEAWWPILASMSAATRPVICARLPFAAGSSNEAALCIAAIEAEPSGEDRSYFAIRTSADISRARLTQAIAAAGVKPVGLMAQIEEKGAPDVLFLVEVDDFATAGDRRLAHLAGDDGIAESVVYLGSYAKPFTASDLAYTGAS